jgi:hypothetical protein
MATTTTSDANDRGDRLLETVSSWPGVGVGPHRFGAVEFALGEREIGHVHGGRVVDIDFPKRVKDVLVAEGGTNDHRFAGGGWTSFYVDSDADVERALGLLRLSYLYTALTLRRKPEGREVLAELDLDEELERLDPTEELRPVFDRMRP